MNGGTVAQDLEIIQHRGFQTSSFFSKRNVM